jgi:surface polysaccharide O-acyltransferase-like enzyme
MQRVENLCVITSIVFLVTGILLKYVGPNFGWSLTWAHTGYGFSWHMLCYAAAVLFTLFAFLYSIAYIPFDQRIAQWHFWLSIGCVVLFVLGIVIFYMAVRGGATPKLGLAGTAFALAVLASLPIFAVTQLLFAVELVRALVKMRPV